VNSYKFPLINNDVIIRYTGYLPHSDPGTVPNGKPNDEWVVYWLM